MKPTTIVLSALFLAASAGLACAHSEHQQEFLKLYTKGKDADADFRKLARKAKCNICHQGKKDRTNYNVYGEALLEHLTEEDRKDKAKIIASLELVAKQPSDPDDEDSPTFGELIKAGKLPGGPLEDSKAEPEED